MGAKKKSSRRRKVAAKGTGAPRNKKNLIDLGSQVVAVYATPKISRAMEELKSEMTLYHGVRLLEVLEAMYRQGLKDGARSAFEALDDSFERAKKVIPHRNPGQPKRAK